MIIEAIDSATTNYLTPSWASPLTAQGTEGFAALLMKGLTHTDLSVQAAENKVAAFATGENIPPHQVMLALEDARMSLQFALQVRSKLVEGYQELMRMQL